MSLLHNSNLNYSLQSPYYLFILPAISNNNNNNEKENPTLFDHVDTSTLDCSLKEGKSNTSDLSFSLTKNNDKNDDKTTAEHEAERQRTDSMSHVEVDTSTEKITNKPSVGYIYRINLPLEKILNKLGSGIYCSDLESSASSTSSSQQRKKETTGRPRPCLIWTIEDNGYYVLPISSFNGRDLSSNNDHAGSDISNNILIQHVLAIDPTTSITNKQTLKLKILKPMKKPVYGYLILLPVFISADKIISPPLPVVFEKNHLLYIHEELNKITKQHLERYINEVDYSMLQMNINVTDKNDSWSESTTDSIPTARTLFVEMDFLDKNKYIEKWLRMNDD